jgi:ribonucleotide reductase beta subunit family protein with ferritin-like domain
MAAPEPLLVEDKSRYVMFPIKYPDVFEMYQKMISAFWVSDEINFMQDLSDYEKLTPDEKHFVNHIIGFFAASDGIVMENLDLNFSNEIPVPEVRAVYAIQNGIEAVHSVTYSLFIDTYVKDPVEKDRLFNAVENFPAIKEKAEWALKWMNREAAPLAQRLIAFSIIEGVFFSASFCAIFWLRNRGLLPGLSFANQLIARDESMHTDFACLLYSKIVNRVDPKVVREMIAEAVDIEKRFITESIPCSMIGMNSILMTDYIMFIADRLLTALGYEKMYNKKNPFPFMEMSATDTKTSFFEAKVASYAKPVSYVAGQSAMPTELTFNNTEDF